MQVWDNANVYAWWLKMLYLLAWTMSSGAVPGNVALTSTVRASRRVVHGSIVMMKIYMHKQCSKKRWHTRIWQSVVCRKKSKRERGGSYLIKMLKDLLFRFPGYSFIVVVEGRLMLDPNIQWRYMLTRVWEKKSSSSPACWQTLSWLPPSPPSLLVVVTAWLDQIRIHFCTHTHAFAFTLYHPI